jgi:hypothetical protein
VQQFFKNAAEVKGEQPLSLPAGSETPCATLRRTEKWVRKATAFRGRANKKEVSNLHTLKIYFRNMFVMTIDILSGL